MDKNKNGPTVVFKDGSKSSVWLKYTGSSPVLSDAAGELPGGAVFKVSTAQAESMLTSDMFRTATQVEVQEHLETIGADRSVTAEELTYVTGAVACWNETGAAAAPKSGKNSRRK